MIFKSWKSRSTFVFILLLRQFRNLKITLNNLFILLIASITKHCNLAQQFVHSFYCVNFKIWKKRLILIQNSPIKTKETLFFDSNTTSVTWVINPTIIPFLTIYTIEKDDKYLCPYYNDGVNHNVLDNNRVLQIVNSCLGDPYNNNDSKLSQLNHLGHDASILIGVNEHKLGIDDNKVNIIF